jgi:hypothetical protein
MKVFLSRELVANEQDTDQITREIKQLTGRHEVEVVAVRKVVGDDGRIRGFEVDIR